MKKHIKNFKKRAGLAPGSATYIGNRELEKTEISLIEYSAEEIIQKDEIVFSDIISNLESGNTVWININGLHNTTAMKELSEELTIHPLFLEDILDTSQRPRFEMEEKHVFVILRKFLWDSKQGGISFEQVSFVLGENWLISFQEKPDDIFEAVCSRLRNEKSRIRKLGSDYLLYSLIDAVVDSYFKIIAELSDKIDFYENEIISSPDSQILSEIHKLKQEILFFRKSCWHLRSAVSNLTRKSTPLISESIYSYFNDLQDNIIQIIDSIETNREILNGLLDIYLSSLSNKMNQIMKTLTIFAAIFIPLTFLAGIYGMNFQYMPELSWKWSYPLWWVITIIIAIVMLVFFKKKKWF